MLHQMKMTDRQKRRDVQHLLARSFSVKNLPSSPLHSPTGGGLPGEIFIPVPQLPRQSSSSKGQGVSLPTLQETAEEDIVSIGELSVEPGVAGVARQQDQDEGGRRSWQVFLRRTVIGTTDRLVPALPLRSSQ